MKAPCSLWSADLLALKSAIDALSGHADEFHLDVMDSNCVPDILFGLDFVAAMRAVSDTPLDVHLMTRTTAEWIERAVAAGAALIAQAAHLEACKKARSVELYALCDAAQDLRDKVAAAFEPKKTFSDYDAMLADEQVEAVIVAIADQFHVPMALRAVEAGKHVLVEKPTGVNVAECERLRDAVRARPGLHVQVGTMRRFDPGIAFAHDFIRDEIGQLLALKAWYCDSIYRYQETDNLHPLIISSPQAKRPAGDPKADKFHYYLLGHASHLVDTARFLGGDLLAVRTDYQQKFGAHSWFVSVEFANGALGHLDLTLPVRMEWHEGFQVYGEHGSVVARSVNPWYFRGAEVECFSTRDGQYRRPVGADGHTFRRQVEGFADVILKGVPPCSRRLTCWALTLPSPTPKIGYLMGTRAPWGGASWILTPFSACSNRPVLPAQSSCTASKRPTRRNRRRLPAPNLRGVPAGRANDAVH